MSGRSSSERAREIDRWLEENGVGTLASYGVGGGILEWWLRAAAAQSAGCCSPSTRPRPWSGCECFSRTPKSTATTSSPTRRSQADAHLFHRVDTELSDAEWRETLRRFAGAVVLVVATEVATPQRLLQELLLRLRSRRLSRAGWLRTRGAFEALWRDTHEARPLRLHDLEGWSLEPRG